MVGRVALGVVALTVLFLAGRLLVVVRRVLPDDAFDVAGPRLPVDTAAVPDAGSRVPVPEALRGHSGALRFTSLTRAEALSLPVFVAAFGDTALYRPAMHTVGLDRDSFTFILERPFADKRDESIGRYRLGRWPSERWMMASNYLNPDGFVEVYPAQVGVAVSPHFRLGDFLTHDQVDVWPKYLVLEEKLVDKLELVVRALQGRGIRAGRVVVLSGFRAPYYNDLRIDEGAVRASRHQFGDAADILIDDDGDGRMDDLNGDGRLDLRDVGVISQAVASVEAQFPDLAGGLGSYAAMGPSGPFAHIDVRGASARWERSSGRQRSSQPES